MEQLVNMNEVVKRMNILFVTLDSLRYDVAHELFSEGKTPNFQTYCNTGWQKCHSPGNFTYAAHHAFFAGFLPTPAAFAKAPRLFAARFAGSETTGSNTQVFDTADIVTGLACVGFRTICIGGVGFFNKQTALGQALPSLFSESYWHPDYSVTHPRSTQNQFEKAVQLISSNGNEQLFLFINVSAIHQPNYFYLPGASSDSIQSHGAALQYVDSQLPLLMKALQEKERETFCIFCSDHGTAYGEDNYFGHRVGHSTVWEVPMSTFILKK